MSLMIRLYQFPISHFCEKARWALDHKGLDYELKNLLPGLHSRTTTKLARHSSVPILVEDHHVIQGAAEIITYLDEQYPDKPLTPKDDSTRQQALEWERYLDKEIGIHLRRCAYHILLNYPTVVIGFFTQDGPWYGKLLLKAMFPKLKAAMHERMKINDETAKVSREHLANAIDRLQQHLGENRFIVDGRFTRADLSAAALLAPLRMPDKYGLNWPAQIPEEFQALVKEFECKTAWVDDLYRDYR